MLQYVLNNWLELLGLVSGLLCVWLLIKENYLTFPIGLLYAVITVVVVIRADLYADVVLNLYYVGMNAYGWYYWMRGGAQRGRDIDNTGTRPVGWVPSSQWPLLIVLLVIGTWSMGWYFATYTEASLPYPDSFTTIASFIAMWMSARKYVESWIWWFVIDVIQIGLYVVKGIEAYAVLYFVYLILAVLGWRAWRQNTVPRAALN